MTFFCTEANIPGLSVGSATQYNPLLDAPIPGDKMIYEDFRIEFLLEETMKSWTGLQDWIRGYSYPESTDQYKNLPLQLRLQGVTEKPQYSDALLFVYSNKNNPLMQIKFADIFPVSLSGVQFNTKLSAETVLTATATFKYTSYVITRT